MKIGLQVNKFTWPGGPEQIGPKLAEIARTADEAGFSSLWVMDHFFQLEGRLGKAEEPMLESYTTLGFMAGVTKKIRLGTMVTGVIYRNPALLVKAATTLDVVSGGRAYLGIGAAWYERESKALGFAFPPIKERFERLEEALQIARQMWSGKVAPYNGKYYQLAETLNSPQPVSQPHPPILIGGSGEQKTLRLVAKYADACNLFAYSDPAQLTHKLDVLKGHCEAVGRSYEEIEITALSSTLLLAPGGKTAAEVVQFCRDLAKLGFQHVIFGLPNVQDIIPLEVFGREIIPEVSSL